MDYYFDQIYVPEKVNQQSHLHSLQDPTGAPVNKTKKTFNCELSRRL